MLKETKILIDNVKNFRNRYMINEGISAGDIRKYMEKHQFVYIFYAGDGQNPRGWRTIRPYVLGLSKAKNPVVRAWQDKGKSVSKDITKLRGNKHDYWVDDLDNTQKPGWRMFRLDRIEQIYPTGQRFVDGSGNVVFPPEYNFSGDKDMISISFQVTDKKEPEPERDYDPSQLQIMQKRQRKDWSIFQRADANRREITRDDVINFRKIARDVMKKGIGAFFIAINDRDEFELVDEKNRNKVPERAIVGNLARLHSKHVTDKPEDETFFEKELDTSLNEVKNKKIGGFPFNIKSFFKS